MVRIFCDICPFRPFSTLPSSDGTAHIQMAIPHGVSFAT
jgi:hypothetical protein